MIIEKPSNLQLVRPAIIIDIPFEPLPKFPLHTNTHITHARTHTHTHKHTHKAHTATHSSNITHTQPHTQQHNPHLHTTHTHTSDQHPPPGSAVGQRSCPPLRLSSRLKTTRDSQLWCVRASQRCVLRQNNRQTAAQQQKCHHFLAPSCSRASPRILAPKAPANRIPGTCTVHGGARHLRPGWLRRPAWPPAGHANDARLSPDCGRYLVPAAAAHTAGCVCRRAGRRYAPRAVRRTFWRTCHLLPRAIHAIWAVSSTPTACDNLLPVYTKWAVNAHISVL